MGDDSEIAQGLGAQFTVAALAAHQQEKAEQEMQLPSVCPKPSFSATAADASLIVEQRGSRFGPARWVIPPAVLVQQWELIQHHEAVAVHSLPDRELRGRVWLWWRLTGNRVADWLTYHLGINSAEWKQRKEATKHNKWHREHEERVHQRLKRKHRRERRQQRKLNAVGLAQRVDSDDPLVQVRIVPALTPGEVRVVIVPVSPITLTDLSVHSGTVADAASFHIQGSDDDEEEDDPVVRQRLVERRRAPSLLVQVGQVWTVVLSDWSFLWICVLFFATYFAQPSLLTVVYPVTLFALALLINPRPPTLYWRLMIVYTFLLLFFRFLFQYPLFALCASLTTAPYYTTQSDLSNPDCNAVIDYSSNGALAQNIAGLIKVTSRPNAESGWFWTFMSGTVVDWLTLVALLIHRKALKDDGLWSAPLLLTPEEKEAEQERLHQQQLAEERKRKAQRAKEREARDKARKRRRAQQERARKKKVEKLARLLHKRQLTESERGQKRRLEEEILAGHLRRRTTQRPLHTSPESKELADSAAPQRLSVVNSVRELEVALREQAEDSDEEYNTEQKREADGRHSDEGSKGTVATGGNDGLGVRSADRRKSVKLPILEHPTPLPAPGDHDALHDGRRARHHHHHHGHKQSSHPHKSGKHGASAGQPDGGDDGFLSSVLSWLRALNDGSHKVGKDFYLVTFLLQLVLFLVVLVFYNLQSNVYQSVEGNYVPLQFVLIVLALFMLIVFERIVYLYQSLLLKLVLQLSSLVTFFIIALYFGLLYSALLEAVYVIFALYWLLSAQQYYWVRTTDTRGVQWW